MHLSIIVVIYDKKFHESKTLQSLQLCDLDDVCLIICNNGPCYLDESECFHMFKNTLEQMNVTLKIKQNIDNLPLSVIYNNEINESCLSNYFMILDDDTDIPNDYFAFNKNNQLYDVGIPFIKSTEGEEIFYPIVNGVIAPKIGYCDEFKSIFSISSGLVISKKLVTLYTKYFPDVFDSRFALYGVDFNFFRRLTFIQHKNKKLKIFIADPIRHSLSRLGCDYSEWRNVERMYDIILTLKYYEKNSVTKIFKITKLFAHNIIKLRFTSASAILYAWFVGMHPRSKKYFSKNSDTDGR